MITEAILQQIETSLGLKSLQPTKRKGGGCINEGIVYSSDLGELFLKQNTKEGSDVMFKGELESLRAIQQTKTVRVPKPYMLVSNEASKDGTVVLVMEALDMKRGSANALLGSQLADLHLHNKKLCDSPSASRVASSSGDDSEDTGPTYVNRFGFGVPTCCGFLPQDNEWCDDWQVFFARKLDYQIRRLDAERSDASVREAVKLWPAVQRSMPQLFRDLPPIVPALLHGDLWSGNVSCVEERGVTVPVIFDAASFYGHHEYDLAIAMLFGGFNKSFCSAYFEKIPKAAGWAGRHELYKLFHYLNHWNHFGCGYAGSSLDLMQQLAKN